MRTDFLRIAKIFFNVNSEFRRNLKYEGQGIDPTLLNIESIQKMLPFFRILCYSYSKQSVLISFRLFLEEFMSEIKKSTQELASFLASLNFDDFSQTTIDMAKLCVQDFIAVAVAGSSKKESNIWKEYYASKPSAPEATVLQPGFSEACAEQAAALNAVFGHVMDMDDVYNASMSHLGVITIPTALALGQKLHKNGKQIIEAIVAGYEAGARIGEAINPSSYKFWHTTGVTGTFTAGAAAGKLLGLTPEQFVHCFGSAGTQSAGLWEFLESGSMSKVLHTAHANLCGIRSAELARLGFTGAPTILEGERGFVRALAPEFDMDCLTNDLGKSLRIDQNSFKPYACCRHTHSADYCVERILEEYTLNPGEIVSIVDDTYSTAVQLTDNPYPENSYAAKFSLQYCIAAAIILKDLSDRAFTQENISNPDIKKLMQKVEVRLCPELDNAFRADPNQWSHRLTITLKNGEVINKQIDYPIGDFKNPFDSAMADRKFLTLTEGALGASTAERLLERIHELDTLKDINTLFL